MSTTAPIIIPVKTKGLSDLQKLEKRMEALERDATKLTRKLPQTSNAIRQTGRAAGTASGNVQRMGIAFRSTIAPMVAALGLTTALGRSLSILAERETDTLVLARNLQNIGQGTEKLVELQEVADKLDLGTLFNSEDFNKGFALLTSFKNIGVDSYERVTKAAADLATITGTDLKSAQLQLAKALENPVEGMTALSRSGTTFTKTQKEFVKSLVESNQGLEAQAYILNIVEGQYSGAAKAAAGGYAGALDTLSKRWRDVNEQIGKVIQPAATLFLNALAGYLLRVTDELKKTATALAVLSRWAQQTAGFIKGLGEEFQIAAAKTYQFFGRLSEVVGLKTQFDGFGAAISDNIDQITSAALRSIPIIGQYFTVLDALKTLRGGINKAGAIEGTDVDSNPLQGADLDMDAIRDQQRWADLMKSFQVNIPTGGGGSVKAANESNEAEKLLTEQLKRKAAAIELVTGAYDKQKSAVAEIEADNTYLQNTIKYGEESANKIREINRLVLEGVPFSEAWDLVTANQELQKSVDKLGEFNDKLTEGEELLKGAYTIVTDSLTSGIQGLIDGTKEWGDVLSDIAGQLGKMFLNAGFSALGQGLKIPGMFADGGRPPTGEVSIVGERGPELFVPDQAGTVISNEQSRAAMGQYNAGNSSAAAASAKVDVSFSSTVINSVEYVTADEFQVGIRKAAQEGAKQGEARAMKTLKNSRSQRSRIGI